MFSFCIWTWVYLWYLQRPCLLEYGGLWSVRCPHEHMCFHHMVEPGCWKCNWALNAIVETSAFQWTSTPLVREGLFVNFVVLMDLCLCHVLPFHRRFLLGQWTLLAVEVGIATCYMCIWNGLPRIWWGQWQEAARLLCAGGLVVAYRQPVHWWSSDSRLLAKS